MDTASTDVVRVHPLSFFKYYWDLAVMAAVFYTVIMLPLRAAFYWEYYRDLGHHHNVIQQIKVRFPKQSIQANNTSIHVYNRHRGFHMVWRCKAPLPKGQARILAWNRFKIEANFTAAYTWWAAMDGLWRFLSFFVIRFADVKLALEGLRLSTPHTPHVVPQCFEDGGTQ